MAERRILFKRKPDGWLDNALNTWLGIENTVAPFTLEKILNQDQEPFMTQVRNQPKARTGIFGPEQQSSVDLNEILKRSFPNVPLEDLGILGKGGEVVKRGVRGAVGDTLNIGTEYSKPSSIFTRWGIGAFGGVFQKGAAGGAKVRPKQELVTDPVKQKQLVSNIKNAGTGSEGFSKELLKSRNTRIELEKKAVALGIPKGGTKTKLTENIYNKVNELEKSLVGSAQGVVTVPQEVSVGQDLIQKAEARFGITDDVLEAGYITPEGKLLDLSGRHESGEFMRIAGRNVLKEGQATDFYKGTRNTDHGDLGSDIANVIEKRGVKAVRNPNQSYQSANLDPDTSNFWQVHKSTTDTLNNFMKNSGVIRVSADEPQVAGGQGSMFADLSEVDLKNITDAQWAQIARMKSGSNTAVMDVILPEGAGSQTFAETEFRSVENLKRAVDKIIKEQEAVPAVKTIETVEGNIARAAQPTTLFHGTGADFTKLGFGKRKKQGIFDQEASESEVIFLSESRKDAEFFAGFRSQGPPRVEEVKIPSGANILDLTGLSKAEGVVKASEAVAKIDKNIANEIDEANLTIQQAMNDKDFVQKVKGAGFDGVRFQEPEGRGITVGVVNEKILEQSPQVKTLQTVEDNIARAAAPEQVAPEQKLTPTGEVPRLNNSNLPEAKAEADKISTQAAIQANETLPAGEQIVLPTTEAAKNWIKNSPLEILRDKKGAPKVNDTLVSMWDNNTGGFRDLSISDRVRIASNLDPERPKAFENVSKIKSNKKTEGSNILVADTIQGCVNNCAACFSKKLCAQRAINFSTEVLSTLEGIVPPDKVLRLGEKGDPLANGKWTEQQMRETQARSEGTTFKDNFFLITKAQKIDGYNPEVMRNLEVTLDPFDPAQMQITEDNVRKMIAIADKAGFPANIVLRVRSLDSKNKSIMDQLQRAVDFSNEMDLDLVETMMRYERGPAFARLLELNIADPDNLKDTDAYFKKAGSIDKRTKKISKDHQYRLRNPVLGKKTKALKRGAKNHFVCDETLGGCPECGNCPKSLKLNPAGGK